METKTKLQEEFESQTPTIKGVTGNDYNLIYCAWLEHQIEKLRALPGPKKVTNPISCTQCDWAGKPDQLNSEDNCPNCNSHAIEYDISLAAEMVRPKLRPGVKAKPIITGTHSNVLEKDAFRKAWDFVSSHIAATIDGQPIGLCIEWHQQMSEVERITRSEKGNKKVPEAQQYDELTECKLCKEEYPLCDLNKGYCEGCIG